MGRWTLLKSLTVTTVLSILAFVSPLFGQTPGSTGLDRAAEVVPDQGLIGLERAMEVQDKYTDALLARDGIEGTGVSLDDKGNFVIKVFTATVGIQGIPAHLESVPVQAVVTGKFVARADPTARFPRPVPIGVSIGHPEITAGTIGCRVYVDADNDGIRDADEPVYVLSNNHVFANSNDASLDDNVLQPGPYDGGKDPADAIGTLDNFVAIRFDGSNNLVDAAIALSSDAELGTATPTGAGYGTPSSEWINAGIGQVVQKYGRTTGWTRGTIDTINTTVNVCYESRGPVRCVKLARFVDQLTITPGTFSDGGDSGSLIVTDDGYKNPVGLLFAGSSSYTIASPIGAVLTMFGVKIDSTPVGPAALSITTESLPDATPAEPYSAAVAAAGGTGSYTWAIVVGGLPAGLVLDTGTGAISGTPDPATAVTQTFTAQVEDGSATTTKQFTLVVNEVESQGEGTVRVSSIGYTGEGGKDGWRHLNVTVALENEFGHAVGGASVSVIITNAGMTWPGTGITGSDGTVTFAIKSAPAGAYTTTVTAVDAGPLTWVQDAPPLYPDGDPFVKPN